MKVFGFDKNGRERSFTIPAKAGYYEFPNDIVWVVDYGMDAVVPASEMVIRVAMTDDLQSYGLKAYIERRENDVFILRRKPG